MKGPWYITLAAVEHWMRVRRYPDDDAHFERAEDELFGLIQGAKLRQTDAEGRQLWRIGRPHKARMIVDTRKLERVDGRDLPRLIWVGQGHPPHWCWTKEGNID